MDSCNNVKGTHDVMGKEANCYSYIESVMSQIAELFGFNKTIPPVLEYSDVFVRGVGTSSDVVRKEMYTFLDKGNRSVTLRPEFTAGIMRLIVQNKLLATNELPLKCYYCGPVFRYERPQLGRYRQFNQFGVEAVGNNGYMVDVETIVLAYTILNSLGFENLKVKINTLGDAASRDAYRDALKEFFAKHIDKMCPDCKSRFELNPLRILDCKVPEDQEIVKFAPKMGEYLNDASKERFSAVLRALEDMEIPYEVDDTLVRGLDYYSDTVYEFHYLSDKGNDYGAIGAGGHYDKLVKELGGPDLPGVGFSLGIERIYSVMADNGLLPEENEPGVNVYVMPMGEESQVYALDIANRMRMMGLKVDMCFDNVKLGNMFKRAEKKNAHYGVIVGENEVKNKKVIFKDLQSQQQKEIDACDLERFIDSMRGHCDCGCEEHHHDEDHECCCGHHHDEEHECCCGHHHEEEEHVDGCCCGHHKEGK